MTPMKKTMLTLALGLAACTSSEGSAPINPGPTDPIETPEEQSSEFEIALSTDKLPVLQGSEASIEVTLTRKNGFAGAVTVDASGLPGGASATPITFEGATTKATLTVKADAAAPHSLPTSVTVSGKSGASEVKKPLTVTVYGPPGSLDTSLAGGRVVMNVGASDDYAYAMAVQADGKILIAGRVADNLGDFAVVRLERDGTPDATFGDGGKVTTPVGSGSDTAYAVAVQPDGKIVVAGTAFVEGTGQDFALVRYMPDGSLDTTFGAGGKVTTAFTNDSDTAYAVLVEPDGKILVAGDANLGTSSTGVDFALARYDANGQLDATFGSGGKTTTPIADSTGRDSIYALTIQLVDGERCIVAAGGEGDFALARYTSKGVLDARFGNGGKVRELWGDPIGAARAVRATSDGKLLVAGHTMHDFALARLGATGQLDPDFGTGGKVITAINPDNDDEAQALAIEADGKIVLGGWVNEVGTSANFALVRYDASGKLDPTFGGTGIVVTEVAAKTKSDMAKAMILQEDERVPTTRVLLAGYASTSNFDFAVTRYWR
jgi:uncharacterized delta-60 repeat protein